MILKVIGVARHGHADGPHGIRNVRHRGAHHVGSGKVITIYGNRGCVDIIGTARTGVARQYLGHLLSLDVARVHDATPRQELLEELVQLELAL